MAPRSSHFSWHSFRSVLSAGSAMSACSASSAARAVRVSPPYAATCSACAMRFLNQAGLR